VVEAEVCTARTPAVGSLAGMTHCGNCNSACCHYSHVLRDTALRKLSWSDSSCLMACL